MLKDKVVSKQGQWYLYNGKGVRPVRIIAEKQSFLGVEYKDEPYNLVLDLDKQALRWNKLKIITQSQ